MHLSVFLSRNFLIMTWLLVFKLRISALEKYQVHFIVYSLFFSMNRYRSLETIFLLKICDTQPNFCFTLTFRSLSATFISRSESFPLPVLATVRWQSGKNLVVHMSQCLAALVPVHRSVSFFPDTNCVFYRSGSSVWFPAQWYIVCKL